MEAWGNSSGQPLGLDFDSQERNFSFAEIEEIRRIFEAEGTLRIFKAGEAMPGREWHLSVMLLIKRFFGFCALGTEKSGERTKVETSCL